MLLLFAEHGLVVTEGHGARTSLIASHAFKGCRPYILSEKKLS